LQRSWPAKYFGHEHQKKTSKKGKKEDTKGKKEETKGKKEDTKGKGNKDTKGKKEQLTKSKFVTLESVQDAMDVFGLFPVLFDTIYDNLYDKSMPIAPMHYFHGRSPYSAIEKKLTTDKHFCLGYSPKKVTKVTKKKSQKKSHHALMLYYAKNLQGNQMVIKQEEFRRFKPKDKPQVWKWIEKVAQVGKTKDVVHTFDNVSQFILFKKGQREETNVAHIKDAVMFSSAYETFEGASPKNAALENHLDGVLNAMDGA